MTGTAPTIKAGLPAVRDYEVGYGKPPAETRFKPGRSGNPKGRPTGSNNRAKRGLEQERLKAIILQEAYRDVTVNDASGPMTIPMAQAIIRAMAINAAKGHQRAQRLFTDLLSTTERDNKRLNDEWVATAINYKVEWERELSRRKALGVSGPDPLPHPDHVVVDMHTGTARVVGPATKEELAQWTEWMAYKPMLEEELRQLEAQAADPHWPNRRGVVREIERTKRALSYLARTGAITSISGRVEEGL